MGALSDDALPREMLRAANAPDWQAGSAEPWIADILAALVVGCGCRHAVEIGGFEGFTSKRLARALCLAPHDSQLTVCELDSVRASYVQNVLDALPYPNVTCTVVCADSHVWLPTLPDESIDFVWLDGDHRKEHVAREIELIWSKMRSGGIIAGHDVYGVCDLVTVFKHFGGYSLDLPRLGPAGGIGLVQVR